MSYLNKLVYGLPLELEVFEGMYEGKYRSRIEEVGERILVIGAPYERGEVVPLREGTNVKLTFWDELSAYSFEAVIMQRIAVPQPMFVLALPDVVTKIQRRNFVRVPANFPLTFRIVMADGLSDTFEGRMSDLSGGGIRFLTKKFIDSDSLLDAYIFLPNRALQTPLHVIRVEKADDGKQYIISSEFSDISERLRDQVVRCVFEIQREMRKKGLMMNHGDHRTPT